MGFFERDLSVWMFACIIAGIALGHWINARHNSGQITVAATDNSHSP